MRGFFAVLLKTLQPALHVDLVDHVRRDDLAAAAVLAHDVVVLRRPLRVLEGGLRAVVRLVPGADHLHLRPALAERLERLRVLAHRRQLAGPLRARRAERRRRTRSAARRRWPRAAVEPLVEPAGLLRLQRHVPRREVARALDAELGEQRVAEHARVLVADADEHCGVGLLRGRGEAAAGERRRPPARHASKRVMVLLSVTIGFRVIGRSLTGLTSGSLPAGGEVEAAPGGAARSGSARRSSRARCGPVIGPPSGLKRALAAPRWKIWTVVPAPPGPGVAAHLDRARAELAHEDRQAVVVVDASS